VVNELSADDCWTNQPATRIWSAPVAPGYRLTCGVLQDRQLAEDAVQEATVMAWRKLVSGGAAAGDVRRLWVSAGS